MILPMCYVPIRRITDLQNSIVTLIVNSPISTTQSNSLIALCRPTFSKDGLDYQYLSHNTRIVEIRRMCTIRSHPYFSITRRLAER